MADVWYYAHDGNRSGPFSGQQLKGLADASHILPTDTVWKEGTAKGVPAGKVRYLFTAAPVIAAPAAVIAVPIIIQAAPAKPVGTPAPEGACLVAFSDAAPVTLDAASPVVAMETGEGSPDSPSGEAAAAADVAVAAPPGEAEAAKPEKAAVTADPKMRPMPVRKLRAIAGKGAQVVGQDGVTVKFRKVCTVCKHQDSCWNTMRIITGLTRVPFFCPKCRKNRGSEIIGSCH
jgi:hypothetical protein